MINYLVVYVHRLGGKETTHSTYRDAGGEFTARDIHLFESSFTPKNQPPSFSGGVQITVTNIVKIGAPTVKGGK